MQRVREFLQAIDRAWPAPHTAKIELRVIDSAALMLQADYDRGTKALRAPCRGADASNRSFMTPKGLSDRRLHPYAFPS